jgi:hypothetical protein
MTTHLAHFTRMLVTQRMVHDILVTEYVEDVWYAKWRMLMWRRKRMVVMQYYAATIRRLAPRNEPVVFGYGDSGFAASGRGEQAVPTSGKIYLLHRVARCLRDVHPVMVVPVDERCTTMKCHGCGNILQSIYAPRQDRPRPLRGLKLCLHCTGHHVCEATRNDGHAEHETNVRLKDDDGYEVPELMLCVQGNEDGLHANRIRNRDKNASMNIWEVLRTMVEGLPRPAYLEPAPRRRTGRGVVAVGQAVG